MEKENKVAKMCTLTHTDAQPRREPPLADDEEAVPLACRRPSGGRRGPPEAPCAAPQCGNGAPALRVAQSTDFPNDYG